MLSNDHFVPPRCFRHRLGCDMHDSKKGYVPMNHGMTLSKAQCPTSDLEVAMMSRIPYASAIGLIMYAMIYTRPNISYAVSMTSRYQANPGEEH